MTGSPLVLTAISGSRPGDGSSIERITPAGSATNFSQGISSGAISYGIAAGSDGALWFTETRRSQVSRIGRITTDLSPEDRVKTRHHVSMEMTGVRVLAGSEIEPCSTTVETSGACVLAVMTLALKRNAGLISFYTTDVNGQTAVSHGRMTAAAPIQFTEPLIKPVAGTAHARACLLDHAAELRALLAELLDSPIRVEIDEMSLAAAEMIYRTGFQ